MQINKITSSNTAFNARLKIDPKLTEKFADEASRLSTTNSISSAISSASTTSSAATGSDVLGTAFSLNASGINSSGIVPSYLNSAANSSLMPASLVNGSQAHPSIAGSIFSTLGNWFSTASIKSKIKDPS
ncbi:MAG: hypothetical protein E7Z87_05645 [Cyanobacteria bacterium SIG26]|nr:hypothetical protein [Cyanobacteria bacterium SIG26]